MNKQEAIERIKKFSEYPGTYPCAIVRTPNVIEVIKCIEEPKNENHLHDIKSQIEYLLEHGPGKIKSLRMLENMVDNMITGHWLSGEKNREASWQDAIQFLEDHFGCEIPRNLDQVIEGFKSMSGLMNTVEFELDKQGSNLTSKEFVLEALERYKQKVKVPAFVAEWVREHCYMGKYVCLERFMCQYNNVELPTDLYNYYDSDKDGARDKVISAILDGYEVEEEPKYRVKIGNGYFINYQGRGCLISPHEKDGIMNFDSMKEANRTADIVGGTVEKV